LGIGQGLQLLNLVFTSLLSRLHQRRGLSEDSASFRPLSISRTSMKGLPE
jgi:hypothetical protein